MISTKEEALEEIERLKQYIKNTDLESNSLYKALRNMNIPVRVIRRLNRDGFEIPVGWYIYSKKLPKDENFQIFVTRNGVSITKI